MVHVVGARCYRRAFSCLACVLLSQPPASRAVFLFIFIFIVLDIPPLQCEETEGFPAWRDYRAGEGTAAAGVHAPSTWKCIWRVLF